MRIELSNIEDWSLADYKLNINYGTTIQVIFRAPNKRLVLNDFSLNLNNILLQIKPDTKFIGITLDASISFSKHIAELRSKLNLCLFMMRYSGMRYSFKLASFARRLLGGAIRLGRKTLAGQPSY